MPIDPSAQQRLQAAGRTAFFQAFLGHVRETFADPATPEDYVRTVRERVHGREFEYVRDVILPPLDAERRERFIAAVNAADLHDMTTLLCLLHAMPTYRPMVLADEFGKPTSELVERKVLRDVLAYFAPRAYFEHHLSAADSAALALACPHAYASDVAGLDAYRQIAGDVQRAAGRVSPAAALVARHYAGIVRDPALFDYGCGGGGLLRAFQGDFRVAGGDLFVGNPVARLNRHLAALRMARTPDEAVDAAGRIASNGILTLDELPTPGSPPRGVQFDVVTSMGVLEHVLDPMTLAAVQRKMASLVKPGGLLVMAAGPTRLGYDGHHLLNPWLGIALHRSRWLRRTFFEGRWREGFTRPVGLREMIEPLGDDYLPFIPLYPNPRRVRQRLGPLTPVAVPVGHALARAGIVPFHYVGVPRGLGGASAPDRT